MSFELLNTSGFRFTQTTIPVSLLRADFGDGYAPPAAIIGSSVRGWNVRLDAVNSPDAEYLWQFWLARKREGNFACWIRDPKDDLYYLVEFTDNNLSFDLLCARAYAIGIELRQRRDRDQASPVTELPGGPPKPDWPEWGVTEFGN